MKQSSIPGISNKKNFQIVLDQDSYTEGEKCGYIKTIFEGEEVKGHIELELAKPEMVKCIRLQLIGYITKSSRIDYQDVLKYINNPENPGGTLQKALKPMKMLSIDSNSGSSSNNKNSDSGNSNTTSSKYDNITILVDYDVVLWGIFKTNNNNNNSDDGNNKDKSFSYNVNSPRKNSLFGSFIGKSLLKESKNEYESRKDMINHKFMASRFDNERVELPFSFKLCHISDNTSVPLPSSYKNGKCQIEYFLYATIHRPWPSRNSIRVMKLRVLQKIKVDLPKYITSLEEKRIKELKFMKCIKKGVIEMTAKIPQKAYCHRDNIPIDIIINHRGMSKTIVGFAVGLYEVCSYEDNNTKKFVKYSFKLLSERFYEYIIKPGESKVYTVLNFPIIDGNCFIQKKHIKSSIYSSTISSLAASNPGSEESIRSISNNNNNNNNNNNININNNNNSMTEDDLSEEVEEKDITKIQLKDAKIPFISATIDEPSKWPIKVEHKLRIVAISGENAKKIIQKLKGDDKSSNDELSSNEYEKDDTDKPNNDYEEYVETDSQVNVRISPPPSPLSNGQSNDDQKANTSPRRMSYMGGNANTSIMTTTKDLFNAQNTENQKYINENKKYGVILGPLSNGDTPTLPKSKKTLDIAFDIVIGTVTRNARVYGKESKLEEEVEDQFYNAIIRKNNINNKLKLVNNSTTNSNSSISKTTQRKEDPDIKIHLRVKSDSSNDSLNVSAINEESSSNAKLTPALSNSSLNKELPVPPINNNKEKNEKGLPQQPPVLPPRTNSPLSTPSVPLYQNPLSTPSVPLYQNPISTPSVPLYQNPLSTPSVPLYQNPQNIQQQQDYQYQYFPNMPQFTNPQEYIPSAPPISNLEVPPPPYEFNPDINSNTQSEEKK